eukprot:7381211-Prymnesium_polylepis.1
MAADDLDALLQVLGLPEFALNLDGTAWREWLRRPRLELLECLKQTGLTLAQRQKLANAYYRALREGTISAPSPVASSSVPDGAFGADGL